MKNITELFLNAADKFPDNVAIIEKDKQITYKELKLEVEQTAAYYLNKGIRQGDRVLIFVPMSIDLYRIVLSLFYIGASAVFLDEWVTKKRMELCCNIADCRGFVGILKARVIGLFSSELRKIPVKTGIKFTKSKSATLQEVSPDQTALITFTTGSTGTPKAADRSHIFLKEQFNALLDEINPQPEDIDMTVLPIVLFVNLGIGCTSVIADYNGSKPDSLQPEKIISQIKKHQINRITASPFFIKALSTRMIKDKVNLNSIQKIFTGGAPVFPAEAKIYSQAFPKSISTIVYGSTESEPISSIKVNELLTDYTNVTQNGLCVGEIYHKTELKIIKILKESITVDSETELEKMETSSDEIGEIIVAGPHVLKKYFNNPEAFKQSKVVSPKKIWHRTGDSGQLINRKLFLTGRCGQLIHFESRVISPFIYENILMGVEGVEIGTILKVKYKIVIVIEPKKGYDESRVNQNLATEIPEFSKVRIISKIPRDPRHNSKIDYPKLLKLLKHN